MNVNIFYWLIILHSLFCFLGAKSIHAATFTNSYDSLNRLTNAAYSDGSSESYSYDPAGNRLSRITTRPLAPTIVTEPVNRTNVTGSSLMLSVSASGDMPMFYQWQKDTQSITGATERTYVITNVQPIGAGNYRVVVSNTVGSTTSSNGLLTVLPLVPPPVLTGPVVNPDNGHFYYLLGQSTWVEAEATAVSLGGHLATVRNQADDDWIWNTFSEYAGVPHHLMIGLYDSDPLHNSTNSIERRAEFQWIDGEPVTYSNWDPGEPNNWNDLGEFYVHIIAPNPNGHSGNWNDVWDSNIEIFYGIIQPMNGVAEVIPLRFSSPILDTAGRFQIVINSKVGSHIEIQVSTNLLDWDSLTTLTNSTGMMPFTDLQPSTANQRFYRARLLQ